MTSAKDFKYGLSATSVSGSPEMTAKHETVLNVARLNIGWSEEALARVAEIEGVISSLASHKAVLVDVEAISKAMLRLRFLANRLYDPKLNGAAEEIRDVLAGWLASPSVPTQEDEKMSDPNCKTCGGCGQIANDDDGTPWKYWAELPAPSNLAVQMGIVKPLPCPTCAGDTGGTQR